MREALRFFCAFRLDCEGLSAWTRRLQHRSCGQCIMSMRKPRGFSRDTDLYYVRFSLSKLAGTSMAFAKIYAIEACSYNAKLGRYHPIHKNSAPGNVFLPSMLTGYSKIPSSVATNLRYTIRKLLFHDEAELTDLGRLHSNQFPS